MRRDLSYGRRHWNWPVPEREFIYQAFFGEKQSK